MKIRFWLDEKIKETEILICADQRTPELEEIKEKISEALSLSLTGYSEDGAEMLLCSDLIRIYAENEKVYAQTEQGSFVLRKKLYEIEQILSGEQFVRISRSELVNIRKIRRLDTSLTGTIRMVLKGDIETYVSRRNIAKIRKVLGV